MKRHHPSVARALTISRPAAFATLACALLFNASFAFGNTSTVEQRNIQTVRSFYDAALNQKDFKKASTFMGATYIQHNPNTKDGSAGFSGLLDDLREHYPQSHWEFKRFIAEQNFVVVQVQEKLHPTDRGSAVVDIFRLDHGKIVEHWDVAESISATSANANGMF